MWVFMFMMGLCLLGGIPRETKAAISVPAAPQVTGSAVGRRVTLTWPKVTNADGYQVLVYSSASKTYRWYRSYVSQSPTISVTYTGKENTLYRYRIYAYRTVNGRRYLSTGTNVSVYTIPSPATTVTSAKVNSSGAAVITWETNSYAHGYKIYRSESASGSYQQIKLITSRYTGTYQDTTVKENKVYYYRVRAFCRNTGGAVYGSYGNTKRLLLAGQTETKKYVFVGDSRTVYMQYWNSSATDTTWICKSSMGYQWLANTADALITKAINSNTDLFLWFGVNDPDNISNYIKYYNSRIPRWKAMGANVYIVGVGQVENDPYVTNSEIISFNKKMKSEISGAKYIDLYTYLAKTGYKTLDGVHYNESTTKKIYAYLLQQAA